MDLWLFYPKIQTLPCCLIDSSFVLSLTLSSFSSTTSWKTLGLPLISTTSWSVIVSCRPALSPTEIAAFLSDKPSSLTLDRPRILLRIASVFFDSSNWWVWWVIKIYIFSNKTNKVIFLLAGFALLWNVLVDNKELVWRLGGQSGMLLISIKTERKECLWDHQKTILKKKLKPWTWLTCRVSQKMLFKVFFTLKGFLRVTFKSKEAHPWNVF